VLLSRDWRLQEERWSSRHRIDGVAVSRAQVLELRPLLLDLTVQGQTQQLARPGQQRRWLDQFAGEALLAPLERPERHFAPGARRGALATAAENAERLEAERCQRQQLLDDLEAAQLEDPAERQRLQIEQDRLAHGVRLQEGVMTLLGRLVEGAEQAPSVLDHLAACERELEVMESLDPSLKGLHQACVPMAWRLCRTWPATWIAMQGVWRATPLAWRNCRTGWPSSRGSSVAMARTWPN
jgi:DNA repair protein RecN (Recombination protein N)